MSQYRPENQYPSDPTDAASTLATFKSMAYTLREEIMAEVEDDPIENIFVWAFMSEGSDYLMRMHVRRDLQGTVNHFQEEKW